MNIENIKNECGMSIGDLPLEGFDASIAQAIISRCLAGIGLPSDRKYALRNIATVAKENFENAKSNLEKSLADFRDGVGAAIVREIGVNALSTNDVKRSLKDFREVRATYQVLYAVFNHYEN